MSKTSLPDRDPIARFLQKGLETAGFKEWLTHKQPAVHLGEDHIAIHVRRKFSIPAKPVNLEQTLDVDILLRLNKSQCVYLVERFDIDAVGHMPGHHVLSHKGLRSARFDDSKLSRTSECWIISCAADVEALLKAYDRLASNTGYPTVFNLK